MEIQISKKESPMYDVYVVRDLHTGSIVSAFSSSVIARNKCNYMNKIACKTMFTVDKGKVFFELKEALEKEKETIPYHTFTDV